MNLIRPELRAAFRRYRELIVAAAVGLAGLWVFGFGGLFYQGLGVAILMLGAALGSIGLRHLRFHAEGLAPGVVRVDEGQITYLAPVGGGFVAMSEITRIDLIFDHWDGRHWRLSQARFQTVTIPAAAKGAEALFDAFVSLPGARPGQILAALERAPAEGPVTVWRRDDRLALT